MRLPLPTPTAVIASAVAATDAAGMAIALVPRAAVALTRMEGLLDRADALMARIEDVATRADATATRAAAVVDTAEKVSRRASRAVDGVTGVTDRVDASLRTWEPTLRRLAPQAERFAASVSDAEVDAAIALVDRLPVVLEHMESDVLPVLRSLDRVGPDVHEVLEVVEDLRRVITGLPGVGLLRRRGDDEPPPIEDGVHDETTRRSRTGTGGRQR